MSNSVFSPYSSAKKALLIPALFSLAFLVLPTLPAAENEPEYLYLKEWVSVTAAGSMASLPPGTRVTKVREEAGGVKVKTAGGTEVSLKETQVTASADEAKALAQAETDKQLALQQQLAASAAQRQAAQKAPAQTGSFYVAQPVTAAPTPASSAPALKRTPISYEGTPANVTVHPPSLKKKK